MYSNNPDIVEEKKGGLWLEQVQPHIETTSAVSSLIAYHQSGCHSGGLQVLTPLGCHGRTLLAWRKS